MAPIQVSCFGDFHVQHEGRELVPEVEDLEASFKAFELLAFLCAAPPRPIAKETLLAAVWSESAIQASRRPGQLVPSTMYRLRQLLAQQVSGPTGEIVRFRGGSYQLNTDLVVSDTHRFLALCERGVGLPLTEALATYDEAGTLYRDGLLTGDRYPWVDVRAIGIPLVGSLSLAEYYRATWREFTGALAERCIREACPAAAARLYRWFLEADPPEEEFVRKLFRCYEQLGDRRALVRDERALRAALRRIYDAPESDPDPELYEPEPETQEAFEQVLAALEAREQR